MVGDELLGLVHLTRLTRLSAAAMLPELDNKQAALLAHLPSLQHLVRRGGTLAGSPPLCVHAEPTCVSSVCVWTRS